LHSITNDITNVDFRAVGPIGLFSSNVFDLDANFFNIRFFIFEKGFLIRGYFPPGNWLFPPFGEKASYFFD
jgi:hypothetical protein